MCNEEKLKMWKFLLPGCMQIICKKIFLQNLCNSYSYVIGFKKTRNDKNLTTKSGSKQKFSLLQEK